MKSCVFPKFWKFETLHQKINFKKSRFQNGFTIEIVGLASSVIATASSVWLFNAMKSYGSFSLQLFHSPNVCTAQYDTMWLSLTLQMTSNRWLISKFIPHEPHFLDEKLIFNYFPKLELIIISNQKILQFQSQCHRRRQYHRPIIISN